MSYAFPPEKKIFFSKNANKAFQIKLLAPSSSPIFSFIFILKAELQKEVEREGRENLPYIGSFPQ